MLLSHQSQNSINKPFRHVTARLRRWKTTPRMEKTIADLLFSQKASIFFYFQLIRLHNCIIFFSFCHLLRNRKNYLIWRRNELGKFKDFWKFINKICIILLSTLKRFLKIFVFFLTLWGEDGAEGTSCGPRSLLRVLWWLSVFSRWFTTRSWINCCGVKAFHVRGSKTSEIIFLVWDSHLHIVHIHILHPKSWLF